MSALHKLLGDARADHKLTQQNVADILGVSHVWVCMMESGRQNLTFKTLVKLAKVYKLPPLKIAEAILKDMGHANSVL